MIGERVRLAREACCLTQEALAEASGLTQERISDIEAARASNPPPDHIDRIAMATGYPVSYFFRGSLPDLPDGYFRKRKKGAVKVTKQVRAQVRQLVELVQAAERAQLRFPELRISPIRDEVQLEHVEGVANEVRSHLGVGAEDAILNMVRAVERAGVVVCRLPTRMEGHDGFSAWPDYGLDGRPIIALSSGNPGDRDRAIVAHELGHLILHTLRSNTESQRAEAEAYRFGGALLLPRSVAMKALAPPLTLRRLMGVKEQYGISIALLARRAFELGLVTADQYRSIHKQLAARKWNRVEPVSVPSEIPLLMPRILEHVGGGGSVSARAERAGMPAFTFQAMLT